MIDYARVNEALERTRLEVRREIMEEGAVTERAAIVAWLRHPGTPPVWHYIATKIEHSEHKSPAPGTEGE